jgi:hypothetical protein
MGVPSDDLGLLHYVITGYCRVGGPEDDALADEPIRAATAEPIVVVV